MDQIRKQEIIDIVAPLQGNTLEEILNKEGITMHIIDLIGIGPDVLGIIFYKDDKYTIFIDNKGSDTRKRFTLAHELGHYFLHKKILKEENTIIDKKTAFLYRISESADDDIEHEANFFAAELLMPADIIKKVFVIDKDIPKLAEKFFVSPLALTYRLINLGLIENG